MKHLHCAICKFTLPVTSEEATTYTENIPMHCGQPMIPDGKDKPHVTPAETPAAKAGVKEEKKGLFGLGGKKKAKK